MSYRITESITTSNFASRLGAQRSRMAVLQERLATNKRINRASDDPSGAEAVMNIRTSMTEIEQMKRNANTVNQQLVATDDTLGSYTNILERVRTLVSQGLSDTTTQTAKDALATELDSLRERILNVANTKSGDRYMFGGTRQNSAPFDPATQTPNATPTSAQYIQIEPGANALQAGVTAENVFSDATSTIFADLTAAAAALRGTGNPAADKLTLKGTTVRLETYTAKAALAQATIGANMKITEMAIDRLTSDSMSLDQRANSIEDADYAETVLQIGEAENTLDATLKTASSTRRSLFDYF
jgi:flagellar hook-associated protein 3 FlgL